MELAYEEKENESSSVGENNNELKSNPLIQFLDDMSLQVVFCMSNIIKVRVRVPNAGAEQPRQLCWL